MLKDPDLKSIFKVRYFDDYLEPLIRELPSGQAPEKLYFYRTKLRSWVEYFGNQKGALIGLLSSRSRENVPQGLFHSRIKEESISIAEEGGRLVAEIRDYLQLQGSRLALLESKKFHRALLPPNIRGETCQNIYHTRLFLYTTKSGDICFWNEHPAVEQ